MSDTTHTYTHTGDFHFEQSQVLTGYLFQSLTLGSFLQHGQKHDVKESCFPALLSPPVPHLHHTSFKASGPLMSFSLVECALSPFARPKQFHSSAVNDGVPLTMRGSHEVKGGKGSKRGDRENEIIKEIT